LKNLSQEAQGTVYAILAFTFWGLVPIYFKLVSHVSPFEVLLHRVLWSILFLYILILFTKQSTYLISILKDVKKLKLLFISALLVSTNWLVFIWAISNNMITEASLGYFINPIVSIILGKIFFDEKISKLQISAILLASIAIFSQIISLGSLPIVSLLLAFSFALYGLARKKINVASTSGLLIETILISPIAMIYLSYLIYTQQNSFIIPMDSTSYLLILAGFITIIPLLWFNGAVTRISMSKLGFLQYIGPSISFILAVFVYNEPLNSSKLFTFILIWIALIVFSIDSNYKNKPSVTQ